MGDTVFNFYAFTFTLWLWNFDSQNTTEAALLITLGEFMFRLEKRLTLQLTLLIRINTEIIVNMN